MTKQIPHLLQHPQTSIEPLLGPDRLPIRDGRVHIDLHHSGDEAWEEVEDLDKGVEVASVSNVLQADRNTIYSFPLF